MIKKYSYFMLLMVLVLIGATMEVNAQPTAISSGTNWLISSQTSDGNWTSMDTTPYYSTVAVLDSLYDLAPASPSYVVGIQWVSGQYVSPTDYLSRRIISLSRSGADATSELSGLLLYRNPDGSWGGTQQYPCDNLDTALALQALKTANYPDLTVMNYGLAYLTGSQNTDGGWGFCSSTSLDCSDSSSSVYMTAIVSSTLQEFSQTTTIATAVSNATSYLIAHQNIDGGFATSTSSGQGSTVYETALAYIALVAVSTDATVLGNAINYLTSTQLPDGSWNDDPYSTALALQALYYSENKPTPLPPAPTTGTVMGTVVDASTGQLLTGVNVTLVSDPSFLTSSNTTGVFVLDNIPQGAQQITLSYAGYAPLTITTKITAGAFINIGAIRLSVNPSAGIIMGTVWDADANAPFPDVVVLINNTTLTQVTAADGSYRFTGISPGTYTISTPFGIKPGYWSASFTGTLAPGGILIFSPALSKTPPPGGLKGTVVDSSSNLPITGATVTLSPAPTGITLSAVTDAAGAFSIPNVPVGSYTADVNASGYMGQRFTVSIMARGETNVTVPLLQKLSATNISGKVTDAQTGNPIALSSVSIVGTNLLTTTAADGTFSLSGITALTFTVRAFAAGYDTLNYGVDTADYGIYTVSLPLIQSKVSTIKIVTVSTDKESYSGFDDVTITAAVENFGDTSFNTVVKSTISDSSGNIVAVIGTANPVTAIAAHSTVTLTMLWNTGRLSAGNYQLLVNATDPGTASFENLFGNLLSEKVVPLSIQPVARITNGAVSVTPGFAYVGAAGPISAILTFTNLSNIDADIVVDYSIKTPSDVVLASGSIPEILRLDTEYASIPLTTLNSTFAESGKYTVHAAVSKGGQILQEANAVFMVLPNLRIETSKTVKPGNLIPNGSGKVTVTIDLKAVEK